MWKRYTVYIMTSPAKILAHNFSLKENDLFAINAKKTCHTWLFGDKVPLIFIDSMHGSFSDRSYKLVSFFGCQVK